ncbi:hypothetical protein Q1695_001859 [Nippostrongylus brasiliensis]|nr:hypothetical protein Q1695_001859 [Nippostrongylus brasiliensis]
MWVRAGLTLLLATITFAQDTQLCRDCIQNNQTWCFESRKCQSSSAECATAITLGLNCPRDPDPAYAYNDTFARYYVNPLIGGLFQETPVACMKVWLPYVSFYKNVIVKCSNIVPNVTCHGYTAWDPVEKAILIVYHGTSSTTEGDEESFEVLAHEMSAFFDNGRLLKYFHDAFMFIWNGALEQQVRTLKYLYPDFKVYVIGHSSGAALADVTASYLLKWNFWTPENLRLVTMGQPRTGDYDFAAWHDATFLYAYRIISYEDPVPNMPGRYGKQKYFHSSFEVWYNNTMAVGEPYTVCQGADGDFCSNTVNNTNMWDHLQYFNVNIKSWGKQGCPR